MTKFRLDNIEMNAIMAGATNDVDDLAMYLSNIQEQIDNIQRGQ